MFILFGWGHQTKDNQGPTLPLTCPCCHNQTFLELVHSKVWFTLFFIPVIPYESNHYLICNVCSKGLMLKGSQVEKAQKMNEMCKSFQGGRMETDRFIREINAIDLMESGTSAPTTRAIYSEKNGTKTKLCCACETQNNPALSKCWKCKSSFAN